MERYFNFNIGDPEENGHILVVNPSSPLEKRLNDYNVAHSIEEDRLKIKLTRKPTKKTPAVYEITVPEMQFSAGAYAPALAINCGPGWSKISEDTISLVLEKDDILKPYKQKSKKGKKVYVSEITKSQAEEEKHAAFLWDMQQLWIAGY